MAMRGTHVRRWSTRTHIEASQSSERLIGGPGRLAYLILPAAFLLAMLLLARMSARIAQAADGMGIDYWSENTTYEVNLTAAVGSKWGRPGISWAAIEK